MRRLVLWDLDGTLVQFGDVGREMFRDAIEAVVGRPPDDAMLATVAFAGRTDLEIALELLATSGVADGERHLPALVDALAVALAARKAALPTRGRALPGAREALAALHGQPGTVQSVLTGNVAANAAVKLAAFGLERFVDLDVGGYGSDHRERPRLVGVARARAAAKYGGEFTPAETVLIGDSPLDVAAALASGARCVAVASGWATAAELAAAGADAVVEDLTGTDRVIRAILRKTPEQRV
jgi:phosphoglycolate phosphatase-like HAD superfamily hydrolase